MYLDGASYLVFAWAVWRCRPRPVQNPAETGDATGLLAAARLIARNPVLASTTAMYLVFNVGLGALLVVVLGCSALGELARSVTGGFVRLPIAEGLAVCLATLLSGVAVAALALSPNALGAAAALALYGAASAPLTIWGQTLRMKIIPSGFHGRCFAIMRTVMQSGGPLGGVSAGFAVPVAGVRAAVAGIALVTCLVGALGLTIADLRRAR